MKRQLRQYAEGRLSQQINDALGQTAVTTVKANFVGRWEWYVRLLDSTSQLIVGLVFGPTAATFNEIVPDSVSNPDFSKVFILMRSAEHEGEVEQSLHHTTVGLDEVLEGIDQEDSRLVEDATLIVRRSGILASTSG